MESESAPNILCLPGPEHHDDFESGIMISDKRIFIHEEGGMVRLAGTSPVLWVPNFLVFDVPSIINRC